jgi:putative inorganic carbon (hco3(-)) transporter
MSTPQRLPVGQLSLGGQSPLTWVAIGCSLALVEALAVQVDWQMGVAVAGGVGVTLALLARPWLILPLAITTIFLEHLTFANMAVTRILAPPALLLVLAEILRGKGRIRTDLPLICAGIYVVWAIASGMWTQSEPGTRFLLQSLLIALVYLFAFAALLNTERQLRVLLYVWVLVASILGGMSVFAFGNMLHVPHLDLLQAGRSQGGVGDPDFFAGMQLVTVPLALVLASDTKDKRLRILLYACTLTLLASTFTSLSRGGFIGVVVLGFLFLVSGPERLFNSRQEKALAIVVVAIGMVGFFSRPWLRQEVLTRAESIYAPKNKDEKSGAGRTNLWKTAAKTARDHPVGGIGYGTFPYVSQELLYKTPGVDAEIIQERAAGHNLVAHNTYLGTSAELGITGLMIYLGVILSTGMLLARTAKRASAVGAAFISRISHALILGLVTWSVIIVFLSAETARMFWVIVALSLALPKMVPEPVRPTWLRDQPRSNAPTS